MATERLTISCDDCVMAGSTACADCLVTYVVRSPLQVLRGGADELDRSVATHPAGRALTAGAAPCPVAAPARAVTQVGPATARIRGPRQVRLSAEQADAVRTLADAGLVGEVRFVPRAAG